MKNTGTIYSKLLTCLNYIFCFTSILCTLLTYNEFFRKSLGFAIWITLLGLIFLLSIFDNIRNSVFESKQNSHKLLGIFSVLLTICFTVSFYAISKIPYITVGDEVRDGALLPMQVARGLVDDYFGLTWSQGMIYANILSYFNKFFGNTELTYRVPGAFIAIAEALIAFSLLRKSYNLRVAFFTSLIIITLPAHIFFSRSEPLITISSLITTLSILFLFNFKKIIDKTHPINAQLSSNEIKISTNQNFIYGIFIGMGLIFHSSARVPALFCFFIYLIYIFKNYKFRENIKSTFFCVLGLLSTYLPYSKAINISKIFGAGKLNSEVFNSDSLYNSLNKIIESYLYSLNILWEEKLVMHYDSEMLFSHFIITLVIVGIVTNLFFKREYFLTILCSILVLLVLFTNSAITDRLNLGNRLLVLLPPIAILAAIGIDNFSSIIRNSFAKSTLLLMITFVLISNACVFLSELKFLRGYEVRPDNSLIHALNYIIKDPDINKTLQESANVCILTKEESNIIPFFQTMHYKEFLSYFFPKTEFKSELTTIPIKPNSFIISPDCETITNIKNLTLIETCTYNNLYNCPSFGLPINIYIPKI